MTLGQVPFSQFSSRWVGRRPELATEVLPELLSVGLGNLPRWPTKNGLGWPQSCSMLGWESWPPQKRPGLATELLPELLSSAELDPGSWHLDEDDRDDEDLYIMPMCGFLCVSRKMTTFCIWVAQMSTFSRRSVGDPCESRKWYTLLEKWALSQKAKLRKMSTFCMLLTINVHFFYLSVSLSRFILALCHQYEFWHVVSRYKSPTLHNSHWLSKHKSWIKKNCALELLIFMIVFFLE